MAAEGLPVGAEEGRRGSGDGTDSPPSPPPPPPPWGGSGREGEAEAVAAGWMLDFMCLSLCRAFRQGRLQDFERSRDTAEAIIHGLSKLSSHQRRTIYICQFLTRIAEGKTLDAQFESDERITPLESALSIWSSVGKDQVLSDKLSEEIRDLIKIQAVAVCLEKGNIKEAEEVLERVFGESNPNSPDLDVGDSGRSKTSSLKLKLLTIISRKDPYHPFLQHFSYPCMMEKIKSFVDLIIHEKASGFLVREATKVVDNQRAQTQPDGDEITVFSENNSATEESNNAKEPPAPESPEEKSLSLGRSCRNLLFLSQGRFGSPQRQDGNEKRTGRTEAFRCRQYENPAGKRKNRRNSVFAKKSKKATSPEKFRSRKKQMWSWEEDMQLKSGVRKYGEGNWTKILFHYQFNNRTNVMLKDRWRTLKKLDLVDLESEPTN
ncbi:telomeric repeat-binding factor 1 isoform X1 [Ornithorhynchus anatinus]|uniref:Telomeric repeat-binding factor n=1 Tax=Ornithorhynchus anatinus TaxID=9258 RepID=F7F093_ORNAN|nr:telomeric repeat-binding factor 1 isoform X1 [Ornithorhynchus anatinus]